MFNVIYLQPLQHRLEPIADEFEIGPLVRIFIPALIHTFFDVSFARENCDIWTERFNRVVHSNILYDFCKLKENMSPRFLVGIFDSVFQWQ